MVDIARGQVFEFERARLQKGRCHKMVYSATIVSTSPSVLQPNMLEKFSNKIYGLLNDPSDPNKYKRNLLKLEIYYEEFNYENIAERPSYTVSTL